MVIAELTQAAAPSGGLNTSLWTGPPVLGTQFSVRLIGAPLLDRAVRTLTARRRRPEAGAQYASATPVCPPEIEIFAGRDCMAIPHFSVKYY